MTMDNNYESRITCKYILGKKKFKKTLFLLNYFFVVTSACDLTNA